MLKQFIDHFDRNKLFEKEDKILLTVSGGLDSMVMLNLFRESGLSFGVAHCNFQLRGSEADGDEMMVGDTCNAQSIPFYVTHFDTEKFAVEQGISIQMAARSLRYEFFDKVCKEHQYSVIATAHHFNDHIETIFLNLIRGTGIDGLKGISVKHNNIVRPLLFATRAEIEAYAKTHSITWREDSSNTSNKYYRNLLRNEVMPLLRKINPSLEDSFKHTSERLQGSASLQQTALVHFKHTYCQQADNDLLIDQHHLMLMEYPHVVLWEIVKDCGFNFIQCKEITSGLHQSGKVFYSSSHKLIVDRQCLILALKEDVVCEDVVITADTKMCSLGNDFLEVNRVTIEEFSLTKNINMAQLDIALLNFPLQWRRWKAGDQFMPLGMKHHKKLSDFLIDAKVSLSEKEKITVLESAGEIVWVVGYRIDDRFKITTSAREVLILTLKSKVSL